MSRVSRGNASSWDVGEPLEAVGSGEPCAIGVRADVVGLLKRTKALVRRTDEPSTKLHRVVFGDIRDGSRVRIDEESAQPWIAAEILKAGIATSDRERDRGVTEQGDELVGRPIARLNLEARLRAEAEQQRLDHGSLFETKEHDGEDRRLAWLWLRRR